MRKLIFTLILSMGFVLYGKSQQIPIPEEFKVSAEFRPRAEVRNGYRHLRNDTTRAAFFISQRSRIRFHYQRPGLIFHTSIQDVRVWGEDDPRSTGGTLQVFETYLEPSLAKGFSVRIGRQTISYDNQRLFSQNNFRQSGRSHDAVRFIYGNAQLKTELAGAFNQNSERVFETDYAPGFDNYKVLLVHYLRYRLSEDFTLTTINATDGYQDKTNASTTHYRFTHGGRVEYEHDDWYLTLAGYYQHGHTVAGKQIDAFHFQPEARLKLDNRTTFWLGAEMFSGEDVGKGDAVSRSFVPLYGSNHRFLGNLDYFTSYPGDFNNAGIVNPYLFVLHNFTEKLALRLDNHLFYSFSDLVVNDQVSSKYLGLEHDLSLLYAPNDYTKLNLGLSWMIAQESMEHVKKGGNSSKIPYWSYLEISFTPELFKWSARASQ